jgi:hypothetical protein
MYRREQERSKRNAELDRSLRHSARTSWNTCADASRALLTLGKDPEFRRLVSGHHGLLDVFPASLAASISHDRADAILQLTVARAALRPLLVRVEVLGWLAYAYPDALVSLLGVVSGDSALPPMLGSRTSSGR